MRWSDALGSSSLWVADAMKWLTGLLGNRTPPALRPKEQALIIELDGVALPAHVYAENDTSTLEDLLQDAIGELGTCDGGEHGPESSRIFIYGADAEALYRAASGVLAAYPLAAGALVTIRQGPPGSSQREIRLPL